MRLENISLPFNIDLAEFMAQHFKGQRFVVLHQALDARRANRGRVPVYHYQVQIGEDGEFLDCKTVFPLPNLPKITSAIRPIIVGTGPAGLWAALRMVAYGVTPLILEGGDALGPRKVQIARCWRYGELDPASNIYLGEGGAGLFSDGKLNSRTKSPLKKEVFAWLAQMGVAESILVDAHPHVGSDGMKLVLTKLKNFLAEQGVEILYRHLVTDLIVDNGKVQGVVCKNGKTFLSDAVFLATGQSSDELYFVLAQHGAQLESKDLAVGVRLENPASFINQAQYGKFAAQLPPARYTLKCADAYSFCMCPGGYVINASSRPDGLVVNGMSNKNCASSWSNAAIVVPVSMQGKSFAEALAWQREIEQKAYGAVQTKLKNSDELSGENPTRFRPLPAQTAASFVGVAGPSMLEASSPSGVCWLDLAPILGEEISTHLRRALLKFDQQMPGLIATGLLYAPETRTSSAVKIQRDDLGQAIGIQGLWPCGEGFGHGGGIVTAAIDGLQAVDSWALLQK